MLLSVEPWVVEYPTFSHWGGKLLWLPLFPLTCCSDWFGSSCSSPVFISYGDLGVLHFSFFFLFFYFFFYFFFFFFFFLLGSRVLDSFSIIFARAPLVWSGLA